MLSMRCVGTLALSVASTMNTAFSTTIFAQSNLVSDIPGLAANLDTNLKNPWGVSFGPTNPFWVSNQFTGTTTLYNGAGTPQSLVVAIPSGEPTGQVFNSSASFVEAVNGQKALFLFASESGAIDAWNPANGNMAVVVATTPNAAYTGLALASNGSGDFLYAANLTAARIDVFDSAFNLTTLPGSFTDPGLPAGYAPFNIEAVNGQLYVEYALLDTATGEETKGPGLGVVSVFDTNGNFIRRLTTGGPLNAPWGIALAPNSFGDFANKLLIGNFGDGTINAFDPGTGSFLGTLRDAAGNPIVNDGLWALKVRTGGPSVNPNALYFTAGINDEANGLFGSIQAVPEPFTAPVLALAFGAGIAILRRRK